MSPEHEDHPIRAFGGPLLPRGLDLTGTPLLNKGTAFTERERDALGLRGLLPPRIFSLEEQVNRIMLNLRRLDDPLQKYVFLTNLQNRNEILFYRVLHDYAEEMIPIIYTPTVGQACLEYGALFRQPRGLFITIRDQRPGGRGPAPLALPRRAHDRRDGRRAHPGPRRPWGSGHGYPGREALALYGLRGAASLLLPSHHPRRRDGQRVPPRGPALHRPQPEAAARRRVRRLHRGVRDRRFRQPIPGLSCNGRTSETRTPSVCSSSTVKRITSFNDDIQGTAAVAVAGIIAALRTTGGQLREQRILFLGAGEAGTGIADLFVEAIGQEGVAAEVARRQCVFVDSQGLVVRDRPGRLAHHKVPYAHDLPFVATLAEAVENVKPTVLVGVSGTPRTFTRDIVQRMAALNERPVVFALSNPTSRAECTAEEAYGWSEGRAIFASGSPFAPVTLSGRTHRAWARATTSTFSPVSALVPSSRRPQK